MNNIARIYLAEILRATYGSRASEAKVADIERLRRIAERLAESEEAHSILRARGHGGAGMSLVDLARSVPTNVRQVLRSLFAPRYPDISETHDTWSAH